MSTNIVDPIEPVLLDRAGLARLGVVYSNAWLINLERKGLFPRRLSLGARRTSWLAKEVMEFIAKRAAERDTSAVERQRAVRSASDAAASVARDQALNA